MVARVECGESGPGVPDRVKLVKVHDGIEVPWGPNPLVDCLPVGFVDRVWVIERGTDIREGWCSQ